MDFILMIAFGFLFLILISMFIVVPILKVTFEFLNSKMLLASVASFIGYKVIKEKRKRRLIL